MNRLFELAQGNMQVKQRAVPLNAHTKVVYIWFSYKNQCHKHSKVATTQCLKMMFRPLFLKLTVVTTQY